MFYKRLMPPLFDCFQDGAVYLCRVHHLIESQVAYIVVIVDITLILIAHIGINAVFGKTVFREVGKHTSYPGTVVVGPHHVATGHLHRSEILHGNRGRNDESFLIALLPSEFSVKQSWGQIL